MLDRSLYQEHGPHVALDEARFARAVADVFALLRPLMSLEETGGVLITRIDRREHVTLVGRFEKYTPESSYRIAREKLNRTFAMRRRHGHTSAWQSHNPRLTKYAGAFVLAPDVSASISGLSAHWDETLLGTAGWMCGHIDLATAHYLGGLSKNPHMASALDTVYVLMEAT